MGTINRQTPPELYNKLREESVRMGETNDCAVVAVAAVSGRSYEEAHAALAAKGRKKGKGAHTPDIESVLRGFGCILELVNIYDKIASYPGRATELQNVTTHHPDRYKEIWADGERYLFYTRSHVGAVINGENTDWTRGKAKRVIRIVKVIP